jgi:hypothetical protein
LQLISILSLIFFKKFHTGSLTSGTDYWLLISLHRSC